MIIVRNNFPLYLTLDQKLYQWAWRSRRTNMVGCWL